ncbi:MAG: CRISPR-associated DxTHG motif protein [Pyrinomonadaceae bacterium]|nr:CRISPR-associated DxTHG motif protein [Pyrinomonadaceae bacterium]
MAHNKIYKALFVLIPIKFVMATHGIRHMPTVTIRAIIDISVNEILLV